MGLSYVVHRPRCRVIVTVTAQPTLQEFISTHEAFLSDPLFEPGMDILWDRRGYPDVPDASYIKAVIAYWKTNQSRLGSGYVATVVPDGVPAAFGMARMAETLGRPEGELRAFNDYDEAIRWLDERFERHHAAGDSNSCSTR
jgi:hypothetical protein